MAGITIGLDFGTHQTKVCVEDRTDKRNPRYSFLKFEDLEGNKHFVLPSVVQVNNDDTLSYGYVDESRVKYVIVKNDMPKPEPPEKIEELVLPPKPELPTENKCVANDFSALGEMVQSKQNLKNQQQRYKSLLWRWERDCNCLRIAYEPKRIAYEKRYKYYQSQLEKWKALNVVKNQPLLLRYFKQVCFSEYPWKYDIPVEYVSAWYLAYILFDIEDIYEQDFQVKMGISAGMSDLKEKQKRAVSLMLSAYYLVEDVFENDKRAFLDCKIDDLINKTQIFPYSDEDKDYYSIFVFPEAYANLRPITKRNKVTGGLNLIVDIGGGTTDITFFSVDKDHTPYISDFVSLPYGLNFIIENSTHEPIVAYKANLDSIDIDKILYDRAFNFYRSEIIKYHGKLSRRVFNEIHELVTDDEIYKIMHQRPIIYTGGGSTYRKLCKDIGGFSDIRYMRQMFDSQFMIEDRDLVLKYYPILSTSLGLTLCEDNDDVKLYNISLLFKNVKDALTEEKMSKMNHHYEYGIDDD